MGSLSAHSSGDFSPPEVATYYAARLPNIAQRGREWRAHCPIHKGTDDNFAVNGDTGLWFCHSQCGRGGSMLDLEMELTGEEFSVAANEVRRIVGRPTSTQPEREPVLKWGLPGFSHQYLRDRIEKIEQERGWRHTAIYPYFRENFKLSYVKVRFLDKQNDKTFRQWAVTAKGGWASRKKAQKGPLLYRLDTLAEADEIFIVNGEKAADRGASELGLVTTCAPDGEGQWCGEFTRPLMGKAVRIITDNDEKGATHGTVVSKAIAPHVREVKLIRLPGLPPKGDLWDWIEAGGTRERLDEIVAKARSEEVVQDAPAVASNSSDINTPDAGSSSVSPAHKPAAASPAGNLILQPLNDTGNADRLIAFCGDQIRYCPPLRKWLVFDTFRWAVDDKGLVRKLAKKAMIEFLTQADASGDRALVKFACHSLDARRIAAMLSMAECELVIMPDQLDTHPFLLNFLNGTLDLTTGLLAPHNREQFITRLVHHNYNPEASCPLFLAFIARVMGNHPDASEPELNRAERMVAYLQRALGYSLTGSTEEKAVFVPFGSGNNGKTTLLSTFLHLVEEYAVLLQVDTLMVRQETNNTQADLADLRGARFVMTSETEEGQRLSQGKLKRITQGMGKIKAVRKYENPIEFLETHKLWMDTNTKPVIRAADDQATFNRLHPIPFTVTISPEEIDKSLPRKLLAEAEGILAWTVAGAVEWRRAGLGKPPEVSAANEDWKSENDQMGRFIEDCCVVNESLGGRARVLYTAYRSWAEDAGENAVTETMFGRRLKARGFSKAERRQGTVYTGIALRANEGGSEENQ